MTVRRTPTRGFYQGSACVEGMLFSLPSVLMETGKICGCDHSSPVSLLLSVRDLPPSSLPPLLASDLHTLLFCCCSIVQSYCHSAVLHCTPLHGVLILLQYQIVIDLASAPFVTFSSNSKLRHNVSFFFFPQKRQMHTPRRHPTRVNGT